MHLKAFEVRNYRAFVEPARIELRPLTLLFGYNNSGKSALARVLPLVRDSVQKEELLPLNLESEVMRGGEFQDLRSKQTGKRTIELAFELEDSFALKRISLVLQELPEKRRHVIESFRMETNHGKDLEGRLLFSSEDFEDPLYELHREGVAAGQLHIRWRGLSPEPEPLSSEQLNEEKVLLLSFGKAISQLRNALWVGAVRLAPPRASKISRSRPKSIAPNGVGASDVLAWDKQFTKGQLFTSVADWYAEHARHRLDVLARGDEYSLSIGSHEVNLGDAGEGLAQVLPVLVAAAMAAQRAERDPSYLVVEQPELHLHPEAQASLADFFCKIAADSPSPRMLLETHSENFLFGVQIAVAEGRLDPAKVLIYWVHQDEQGYSSVTPIQLDRDGRPDYWPKGVFREETELARRLLEVRRQKSTP